jgi:hypothetical protein
MELLADLDREIVIVGETRRGAALQKVADATYSRGP